MSRVLLELLDLAAGKVHTAKVEHPRVELKLEVTDPRSGKARVLPPGPDVLLVDATGNVIDKAEVVADGRVHLLGDTSSFDSALEIDFVTHEWLDLDADHYVAEAEVTPNDPRALLRLPRRWRSRAQSAFSDDRGGLFGGGSVLHLKDGELGTEADPWVLRIDHGWKKFALELRYTNTVTGDESLLPAGPVVRALFDGPESKLRLAAASTVLDSKGLVALWVFDAKPALADLRIVMRTADASYIDMGDGVLKEVSRAKHRAMLPKARARLHALPERLRLDQQPGEQGALAGPLASLLSSAGEAPEESPAPHRPAGRTSACAARSSRRCPQTDPARYRSDPHGRARQADHLGDDRGRWARYVLRASSKSRCRNRGGLLGCAVLRSRGRHDGAG